MNAKDLRDLARTLTQIESGGENALVLLKNLYPKRKGTPILGITGLPGAGKSTLVDQLIDQFRKKKLSVAVIAIDPSSPFSGGAVLGDRIRMQRHASDASVFIRSVGSRGAHGGLSRAAKNLCLCFDAFQFDRVIVETVGVGQTELDIMGLATTTVVVLMPEAGDVIQTLKAGLNEIADIFVVNKADREGAKRMQQMLLSMTQKTFFEETRVKKGHAKEESEGGSENGKPVLLVEANKGLGVSDLLDAIQSHENALKKNSRFLKQQEEVRGAQFLKLCGDCFKERFLQKLSQDPRFQALLKQVVTEKLNPYEALEDLLKIY